MSKNVKNCQIGAKGKLLLKKKKNVKFSRFDLTPPYREKKTLFQIVQNSKVESLIYWSYGGILNIVWGDCHLHFIFNYEICQNFKRRCYKKA